MSDDWQLQQARGRNGDDACDLPIDGTGWALQAPVGRNNFAFLETSLG